MEKRTSTATIVGSMLVIFGLASAAGAQPYPYQPQPDSQLSALPPGSGAEQANPYQAPTGPNLSPTTAGNTTAAPARPRYPEQMTYNPYTSGMGPCLEGGNGSGCARPTGKVIQPSKY